MDFTQAIEGVSKLFQLVISTPLPATFSGVGLLLLLLALGMGYKAIKAKPQETPTWLPWALFGSLFFGVVFSAAGPSIALLRFSEDVIAKIGPDKAFENLKSTCAWIGLSG